MFIQAIVCEKIMFKFPLKIKKEIKKEIKGKVKITNKHSGTKCPVNFYEGVIDAEGFAMVIVLPVVLHNRIPE